MSGYDSFRPNYNNRTAYRDERRDPRIRRSSAEILQPSYHRYTPTKLEMSPRPRSSQNETTSEPQSRSSSQEHEQVLIRARSATVDEKPIIKVGSAIQKLTISSRWSIADEISDLFTCNMTNGGPKYCPRVFSGVLVYLLMSSQL